MCSTCRISYAQLLNQPLESAVCPWPFMGDLFYNIKGDKPVFSGHSLASYVLSAGGSLPDRACHFSVGTQTLAPIPLHFR